MEFQEEAEEVIDKMLFFKLQERDAKQQVALYRPVFRPAFYGLGNSKIIRPTGMIISQKVAGKWDYSAEIQEMELELKFLKDKFKVSNQPINFGEMTEIFKLP